MIIGLGGAPLEIRVIRRDFEAEANIVQAAKCDFLIRAGSADDLARIMSGRVENPNVFVFNYEVNRVTLDTPAYPMAPDFTDCNLPASPACIPRITGLAAISYGREEEVLASITQATFPMLRLTDFALGNWKTPGCDESDFTIARRLASELGVTDTWDEPAVKKESLQWTPSKLEGEQDLRMAVSGWRWAVPVCDTDGIVRHLIYIGRGWNGICILPLSFAQHRKYSAPLPCFFTFDPCWFLMNSEFLPRYPEAEVLITNEIGVVLNNNPTDKRIVLGYFFGPEMIPFLHLDCLLGRCVKILFLHHPDPKRFARNVKEAILLLARLEKLGIEASCYIAEEDVCIDQGRAMTYYNVRLPVEDINFEQPIACDLPELLTLARKFLILIPENLRPDRFDALTTTLNVPLVHNFLAAGGVTAIRAHNGCDLSLFTASVLVGMMNGRDIFPGKWQPEPNRKIRPIVFIPQTAAGRYNRLIKESFGYGNFTFYAIPAGSEKEIEQRFSDIRHKTDGNVMILAAPNLVTEHKKVLETACIWAQKEKLGLIICTSEDSPSAETVFTDHSERDIHVWRVASPEVTYIVEDRDPLNRNWNFFKITLAHGQWITKEVNEEEIKSIEGRKIAVPNYNAVNPEKIDDGTLNIIKTRNKKNEFFQ